MKPLQTSTYAISCSVRQYNAFLLKFDNTFPKGGIYMIYSNIEDVLPEEQHESEHLLGNGGAQVMEAYSEEDISHVLAYAYEKNKTVNVVAGGTKRGLGGELAQADILLSLTNYKGIVEHSVGDLTMT